MNIENIIENIDYIKDKLLHNSDNYISIYLQYIVYSAITVFVMCILFYIKIKSLSNIRKYSLSNIQKIENNI